MKREVSSKFNGTIQKINFHENDAVPGGSTICVIDAEEEKPVGAVTVNPGDIVPIILAKIGGSSATVKKWYKAVGDDIRPGEPIVSLSAGKLNTEVTSPFGGILKEICTPEGSTVKPGDTAGNITADGTGSAASEENKEPAVKIAVIGGGPGGYVAAIRAAQLGAEVTLIEEQRVGGTCLNRGCIPTKALLHSAEVYLTAKNGANAGVNVSGISLDWDKVMKNRQAVSDQLVGGVEGLLAANGAELIRGRAEFAGEKTLKIRKTDGGEIEQSFDRIIIATGSSPAVPPIPGLKDNPNCIDSTGALALPKLPASMVIIGGGVIGIELACAYAAFGTKVTIVEMMDRIMPVMDYELTLISQKIMEEKGIEFFLETQVLEFRENAAGVDVVTKLKSGEEKIFTAEKALVAVGRRSNIGTLNAEKAGIETDGRHIIVNDKMETNVKGVYAIGDCVGKIMLAHTASTMGEIAAENAMGGNEKYDERVCPSCVYMLPEFAYVGINEEQAKAEGISYKVGKFPLKANGKSLIMEETDGWMKIIAEKGSNQILGVHILGARATDVIAEAAMAMSMKATVDDMIHTIHAHPTVAEAMKETAMAVEGRAIHFK
ncbi:MAG: dihydrolipoyl dehydrogenase [Lachnospiraceae bacterium]|nr:dihydrolipoyl dehydrogenase [Lachnospiraceae bacterium]